MSTTINGTDNSAAAPALVGSDTDTGVFFPASNTTAFSNGGAESMRIDSSGNVGIGTTSAGYGDLTVKRQATSATNSTLSLVSGSAGYGRLFFGNTQNAAGEYDGYVQYDQANRLMQFGTAQTERMRINSSGNVGIGTNSPTYRLQVTDTNPRVYVKASSTGYAVNQYENNNNTFWVGVDDNTGSGFNGVANAAILYNNGATPIIFSTNATERLRIDSNGTLKQTLNPSYFNVDASPCTVTLTNGSNVNWGNAYSGVIFVTDTSLTGQSAILICGGGSTYTYGAGQFTNTSGSGTFRFYNSGSGYVLVNASGSTATFGLFVVRTRAST